MKKQAYARGLLYAGLAQAFRKPEAPSEESEDSLVPVLQQAAGAAAVTFDAPALGRIADEVAESLEVLENWFGWIRSERSSRSTWAPGCPSFASE